MTAKAMSIGDILAAVREIGVSKAPAAPITETERAIKRRLREVGGKAADFLPYLEETLNEQAGEDIGAIAFPKKATLAQAISMGEDLFGKRTHEIVLTALERFVADNDTSYKFRSA